VQKLAASTGSGIPVTLSTDPRHHFTENVGTAAAAGAFSQWPETLAFNEGIITDLLRGELGFDGIVCTDWGW